jgi:hypothetical protein
MDVAERNKDKQEAKVTMKNIMAMTETEKLKVTVGQLLSPNKQILWAKIAVLNIAFLV